MTHRQIALRLTALSLVAFTGGCTTTLVKDIYDPEPKPEACAGFVPLATAEEIASAGRPDGEAEVLAIRAGDALVADQALYERISGELAEIRTQDPFLAEITARDPLSNWIGVTLEPATYESYLNGVYDGWDCANDHYGVTDIAEIGVETFNLAFGAKRYKTSLLLTQYETFPGVAGTGSGFTGDDHDVCMDVDGDVHRYLFIEATGDCPSGCTDHEYFAYDVSADGTVTDAGHHCSKLDTPCRVGTSSDTMPQWVEDRSAACYVF